MRHRRVCFVLIDKRRGRTFRSHARAPIWIGKGSRGTAMTFSRDRFELHQPTNIFFFFFCWFPPRSGNAAILVSPLAGACVDNRRWDSRAVIGETRSQLVLCVCRRRAACRCGDVFSRIPLINPENLPSETLISSSTTWSGPSSIRITDARCVAFLLILQLVVNSLRWAKKRPISQSSLCRFFSVIKPRIFTRSLDWESVATGHLILLVAPPSTLRFRRWPGELKKNKRKCPGAEI